MSFKPQFFQLNSSEIHLWAFSYNFLNKDIDLFANILCQKERDRAAKYRFEKDKISFICARGALRILLEKYTNQRSQNIVFKYDEFGKPLMEGPSVPHFNVSHSGDQILLGFCANHPLGTDIEKITTDFDILEIAKNHFYGDEIAALKSLPRLKRYEGFFSLWTRKEAVIKHIGKGLSLPLNSFSVSMESMNPVNIKEVKWTAKWATDHKLYAIKAPQNYKAALSADKKVKAFRTFYNSETVYLLKDHIEKI
ncbi:MAG: 4'-phosphopantetheinyl transferase family protein [Croceivirga sp.]